MTKDEVIYRLDLQVKELKADNARLLGIIEGLTAPKQRSLHAEAQARYRGKGKHHSDVTSDHHSDVTPPATPVLSPIKETPKGVKKVSLPQPPDGERAWLFAQGKGYSSDEARIMFETFTSFYGANGWVQGRNKPIRDTWLAWTGWVNRQLTEHPPKPENDWANYVPKLVH